MPRPILYPGAEQFITAKKNEKILQLNHNRNTTRLGKRHTKKQTFEEKKEKKEKKKAKYTLTDRPTGNTVVCVSCGEQGHAKSRSKLCVNHVGDITSVVKKTLGENYDHFTVSVPLSSFVKDEYREVITESIEYHCLF